MYELGLKTMPFPSILGTAAAGAALYHTGERYWLYGAVALFSVVPYTFLVIMPTNHRLNTLLEQSKREEWPAEEAHEA